MRSAHELNAWADAHEKFLAINHAAMVSPAPADFKPEPVARKIRLRLTLEKTTIRRGEQLRFRLEMTNVGRETITYRPLDSSIFRSGSLRDTRFIHFVLTDPQRKKGLLLPPLSLGAPPAFREIKFPKGRTDAEKEKSIEETNAIGEAGAQFEVKLLPGETLRSRGDADSTPYHDLATKDPFDKPGYYRLQVELDDRPGPLTKDDIKDALSFSTPEETRKLHEQRMKAALGPASSNAVTFEVTP